MEKHIAVVAGIRSQYVKMASFQRAATSLDVRENFLFIDAAQHYSRSLSSQYLEEYNLDFDFSLRKFNLPMASEARFGAMEFRLNEFFSNSDLKHVVVFGDANTTLAAALAAKRSKKILTHIEAGVRTGDTTKEEINRKVTDYLADFHIASCRADYCNLQTEGYSKSSIFIGDIVRDLCVAHYDPENKTNNNVILVTLHHDDDWDNFFLESVFELLGSLTKYVYFFAHPRMLEEVQEYSARYSNIMVKQSTSHTNLLKIISKSDYVITDSGALQRESFYLGKRVLVVQKAPFWQSLIDYGFNISCAPSIAGMRDGIKKIEYLKDQLPPVIDDFGSPPIGEKIIKKLIAL
jgi:UDP-GlcNAc3NAcA epimerase